MRLESPQTPAKGGTGRRSHRIRTSEICVKIYGRVRISAYKAAPET